MPRPDIEDRRADARKYTAKLVAANPNYHKERRAKTAANKAAGIAARDEVRRKLDGDAVKMESKRAKDEIEAVKKRMLGDKPLSEKEIAAAAKAIPEMQKDIAKLVAKLGVK